MSHNNETEQAQDIMNLMGDDGQLLDVSRDPNKEEETLKKIHDQIDWSKDHKYMGESTGFDKLDYFTEGFQGSSVWMLGGATSSGKSQFALSLIANLLERGEKLALFSLEMPAYQNYYRIAALMSNRGAKINDFRKNKLPDKNAKEVMTQVVMSLKDTLEIIDHTNQWGEIEMIVKNRVKTEGVKYFFLDYVQLINGGLNDHKEIAVIAAKIQSLSKKLDVCIILVSQVTKAKTNDQFAGDLETADFKGSGDWENVAGVSLVIGHVLNSNERAEVSDFAWKNNSLKQFPMKISITKNRDGNGTGLIKCASMPEQSKFEEVDEDTFEKLKDQTFFHLSDGLKALTADFDED